MICASCDGVLPPGARFCPACGTRHGSAAAKEERKLVTVVFCDLVGSTPLSEALDPETLRSVTLRYFAAMRAAIERFGGTVEKFIGDAVMAVFGVPTMYEDDAHRAVAAALDMLEALSELNAELARSPGVRLRVRIGVNTGPAVTSTDVSTRQALVSGETVNVAARLEQNAGPGEILIGPVTRQSIGPSVRTEAVGPLRLKGKQAAVTAYRVLGIDENTAGADRRFDQPFVGRDVELADLDRVYEAVAGGSGSRLVTVDGDAGIGKTRLVRVWLDRHAARSRVGAGRCRPYGEHGSLAALAEATGGLLAGASGHPVPDDALAVLAAGLLQDGTPGPSVEGTCAALARVLDVLARDRPVLLVVDDCHWAGDPLLDVLDRLVELTRRSAVLIVCLARPELRDRRPDLGGERAHPVPLGGLSPAECDVLVATLAEVGAHLATVPERIVDASGGNPLYVEQLLAATAETGGGREIPPTLQALLGARIDALEATDRTVLDLASVLGREFVTGHVSALAGAGPEGREGGPLAPGPGGDPVPVALHRLGHRRLVEPVEGTVGGAGARFSNGLVHEATYRAMAKRTRAERHQRAAEVLTARRGTAATVGGHLEAAYRYRLDLGLADATTDLVRRRAAELLAAAGADALTRSDLAWADTLLDRAVTLYTTDDPGWAAAARRLGEIRLATGRADEGRSLLQAVRDTATDRVQVAHARLALAVADGNVASRDTVSVAVEVLPVFETADDDLGQARTRIRMGQERQFHGRHARADGLFLAGLSHAVRASAEPERALALGALGVSLWRGPTPVPLAIARCRELLAEHGGPRPIVRATLSCPLAVLLALDEQWDAADEHLAEARELIDSLGYAEGRVVLPVFTAAVESLAGRPDAALALLESAAGTARRLSARGLLGGIVRDSARILLDRGRVEEAARRLGRDDVGDLLRADRADLDGLRGRLAARCGSAGSAVDLVERAVEAAAATDSPLLHATAAMDQADTLRVLGRLPQALAAAELAARSFRTKGDRPGLRRAVELQARLRSADTPHRPERTDA